LRLLRVSPLQMVLQQALRNATMQQVPLRPQYLQHFFV
jgi:hypothetical protein